MLADMPPFWRDDPDVQAIVHCQAREHERKQAKLDALVANLFPQSADASLLPAWEWLVGTTINPVGLTVAQRRDTVMAYLATLRAAGTGLWWEETVTKVVGPGWSYQEHLESDPTSPPAGTIEIVLPFAPSSSTYAQTEALLRRITDSHIDLVVTFSGGFLLDQSLLDQEALQ